MRHHAKPDLVMMRGCEKSTVPQWALLQTKLIQTMNQAAEDFVARYTRSDGTLVWRKAWPGMDGSDDPYEGFQNFSLLYALGGSERVDQLARHMWDAITWQWTEYGQVYREFDAYYDWMHHGEGSLIYYFFGLSHPAVLKDIQRSVRFANFYTGNDAEAANYDREKRLMRSPINGSRGPRFNQTAEDWTTHREVLDNYPPPFEDIPGVPGPKCPWTQDSVYEQILERINARMAQGDVPLNLTSTSLVTHAYMYTGDPSYREHVLDYLAAWEERTNDNRGIMPDNVGLSGKIGEYMDGKWWGGYYGWRWPHGAFNILESTLIAGSNARLLDGRHEHLELFRSQLDLLIGLGKEDSGGWAVPHKHKDAGWTDFKPLSPQYPIYCWYLSMDDADLERVKRVCNVNDVTPPTTRVGKGNIGNSLPWFHYIQGRNNEYPEQTLRANLQLVNERLDRIRSEDQGNPADWDVHYWQDINPVVCEGLVQLTMGAPMHIYHGGLLHARLRYYDARNRRPGLPELVGALVERVDAHSVTVYLVNTDAFERKELMVQSGAFSEHQFTSAQVKSGVASENEEILVDSKWMAVALEPGCSIRLKLTMRLYVNDPSYETPWISRHDFPELIQPRQTM